MNEYISILGATVAAYLIGAIPTGYCIARLCGIHDITQHGSGNIGATNVARVLGKKFFVLVLLLDGMKAFLMVKTAQHFFASPWIIALISFSVLIGNCYSLFLNGKGGKGVATSIGIIFALQPSIFIGMVCAWLVGYALFRIVGMASVLGAGTLIVASVCMGWVLLPYRILYSAMGLLALLRHENNMRQYAYKEGGA